MKSIPASLTVEDLVKERYLSAHQGYPVVDETGTVIGVVTRTNLLRVSADEQTGMLVSDLIDRPPIVVHAGANIIRRVESYSLEVAPVVGKAVSTPVLPDLASMPQPRRR